MDYIRGWFNGISAGHGDIWTIAGILVVIALVMLIIRGINK